MRSEVSDLFGRVVARRGDRVAIAGLSESLTRTFAALAGDARTMAAALAAALPSGPGVVSAVGNRVAFFPLLLAALEAGAALVLLDGEVPRADALSLAEALGAHGLVQRDDALSGWPETAIPLGLGASLVVVPETTTAVWRHDARRGPVVLKVTSGSSARPRAVVASEANLVHDARQIVEAMGITADDVNLAAIPISHSYGLGNLVMPLFLQGTALALRDRFAPRELAADVASCGVTTFPAVPYVFEHLRRQGLVGGLRAVPRLITAGAPIAPATVGDIHATIGRKIHSFYGTTETGGISYDDSDDVGDPVHVGRPLPRTEVVVRPDGEDDGAGRVFVRGDAVASGYAGVGSAPDGGSRFVDGGCLTGDRGRFDAAGRLTLLGRVSRFINVAGRKVDPSEVRRVLQRMPGVVDAVVLGLACDRRGEQVAAWVHARHPGVTAALVREFCAAHLAAYKIPRQIAVVEAMPVDERGKIDRRALEALLTSPGPARG